MSALFPVSGKESEASASLDDRARGARRFHVEHELHALEASSSRPRYHGGTGAETPNSALLSRSSAFHVERAPQGGEPRMSTEGPQIRVGLTAPQSELLERYAGMLRTSPHNLLSPRGLGELETRHFPESVAFAKALPAGPRVLDVGSGGGLPGLVLAIMRPDLSVELLDATRKKADFLAAATSALGLPVRVHHGRAEVLARGPLAGAFDIVTARAVASLDRLIPWTAPFVRSGGTIHAIKGERWAEELDAALPVLRRHHLEVASTPAEGGADPSATTGGPRVIVLSAER